jgi:hypothetical protein
MEFKKFAEKISAQINKMQSTHKILFRTNVDKDVLYDLYLDSFHPDDNPIYREKRYYDCNCCKSFIRQVGGVVAIDPETLNLTSIWDVELSVIPEKFHPVVKALSKYVKSQNILYPFYLNANKYTENVGLEHNVDNYEDKLWYHFYHKFPSSILLSDYGSKISNMQSTHGALTRTIGTITPEACEIVIELIQANSIYRGEEFLHNVEKLYSFLNTASGLFPEKRLRWAWLNYDKIINKNSVVGTLLEDISNGESLDAAVGKFESKVAPENYKRPSAVVTKSMLKKAEKKVKELGLLPALQRRYARVDDITVNNVIFVDRSVKPALQGGEPDIFSDLLEEFSDTNINPARFEKLDSIPIKDFIKNVIPTVRHIEVYVDPKFTSNFMSLIAPVNPDAPSFLKWDNNFTWSYSGDLADSGRIKKLVKKAGGNVEGHLRCSLNWHNPDDLDIHVVEPSNNTIYYGNRKNTLTGGCLDVDMNVSRSGANYDPENPVENITWVSPDKMQDGVYQVHVNNYLKRSFENAGFTVEIECNGVMWSKSFATSPQWTKEIQFTFSRKYGVTKINIPEYKPEPKWGVEFGQFHPVEIITVSPNHWDDNRQGNKHWFFFLSDCINPDQTRGFYNEFLNHSLMEHRKVFELLASRMLTPTSQEQLSGIGFSSTSKGEVIVKVVGRVSRMLKVII